VTYALGRDAVDLRVDGAPLGAAVRLLSAAPDAVELEVDGVRRSYRVHHVEACPRSTARTGPPRWSRCRGSPTPPPPAPRLAARPDARFVVRVLVEPGPTVAAGRALVVLEAMKMEHTIAAAADGVVTELRVGPGDQVETGQVLAVVAAGEG
jgi:biotin carboxyl carrier protein